MNEHEGPQPLIDILLSPAEFTAQSPERGVVVIDVLRATTVIVRALLAGAVRIAPASSLDAAFDLKRALGGEALLCGEREGLRVEGFDLGNSPLEFDADAVGGRTLILASTNGTVMLDRARGGRRVLVASFNNAAAIARAIVIDGGPWTVVPSGKLGRTCLEDLLCAGRLAALLGAKLGNSLTASDGVRVALELHDRFGDDIPGALANSTHGAYLSRIGFSRDIVECAAIDTASVVPEFSGGWIRAYESPGLGNSS